MTEVRSDAPVMTLRLPARIDSLLIARQAVTGVAEAIGMTGAALDDLRVAAGEACANVVMHAYPEGDGTMELRAWVERPRLILTVRDMGRGLRSPGIPPGPGMGLGLQLMAALSEDLQVHAIDGQGTHVTMSFRADGGPEVPA